MDNHTPVSPNHLEKRYNEGIRKITWRDKLIKMALGALLIDWKKLEMMMYGVVLLLLKQKKHLIH